MKKFILSVIAICLLAAGCNSAKPISSVQNEAQPVNQTVSPSRGSTSTPQSSSSQPTTIEQVVIKTGINPTEVDEGTPYQLLVGGGHYLLWITKTDFAKEKLIYDGKQITVSKNIDHITLSQNGSHYAYSANDSGAPTYGSATDDFYIDGVKINVPDNIQDFKITDDGQHYFYTTSKSSGSSDNALVKDGQEILTSPMGIYQFWISTDGNSYLALSEIDSSNETQALILNGKQIYLHSNSVINPGDLAFSANGQHYAYESYYDPNSSNFGLVVDGNFKFSPYNLNFLQINNSGDYAMSESNNITNKSQVYIDNKAFQTTTPNAKIFINQDASHYLIVDGNNWLLDGKATTAKNNLYSAEINGNTVYLYTLTK